MKTEIKEGSIVCVNRNKTFNYLMLNEIVSINDGKVYTDGEHTLKLSDIDKTFKVITDKDALTEYAKQKENVNKTFTEFAKLASEFFAKRNQPIDEMKTSKMSLYDYCITIKPVTNKGIFDKQKTSTTRLSNTDKSLLHKVKKLSPEALAALIAKLETV